jgi:predicted cobalt transporter CbtA
VLTSLKRGVLSGAVGGVLAGAFGYLLAEPVMDRAVDLEAARQAAAGEHTVETFSRSTQHLGFLGATLAVGIALGVLFAVVHHLRWKGDTSDAWGRALRLGGGAFFALTLVPFIRYPPNPPGVGDPETIGQRDQLWEVSLVIGLVGALVAGLVARGLAERRTRSSLRHLAVAGVLACTVALTFVLPGDPDEIAAPAQLMWDFRLLSIATQLLLWGGLAATFGLLVEQARRVRPERERIPEEIPVEPDMWEARRPS